MSYTNAERRWRQCLKCLFVCPMISYSQNKVIVFFSNKIHAGFTLVNSWPFYFQKEVSSQHLEVIALSDVFEMAKHLPHPQVPYPVFCFSTMPYQGIVFFFHEG